MPDDTPNSAAAPQPAPDEELHLVEELEAVEHPKGARSPLVVVGIGAVIIFVVLAVYSYFAPSSPSVTGSIEDVTTVAVAPEEVLVAARINLQNPGSRAVTLRDVKLVVETPTGEIVAKRLAGSEYPRVYRDFPELRERSTTPLAIGTPVGAGMQERGTAVFSVPTNFDAVNTRKGVKVIVDLGSSAAVVLTK